MIIEALAGVLVVGAAVVVAATLALRRWVETAIADELAERERQAADRRG